MTLHQEWKEILERLSNDSASWAWYAMDSKRAKKAHIEEPHFDVDKALLALVKSLKAKMPKSKKYGTNLEGYEGRLTQKLIKERIGEITGYNTAVKEFNTILDELEDEK